MPHRAAMNAIQVAAQDMKMARSRDYPVSRVLKEDAIKEVDRAIERLKQMRYSIEKEIQDNERYYENSARTY